MLKEFPVESARREDRRLQVRQSPPCGLAFDFAQRLAGDEGIPVDTVYFVASFPPAHVVSTYRDGVIFAPHARLYESVGFGSHWIGVDWYFERSITSGSWQPAPALHFRLYRASLVRDRLPHP